MTAGDSIKRALWCRWAHRWRMLRPPAGPVVNADPSGRGALRMTAGPGRDFCRACDEAGPGWSSQRIMDRWLAS